MPAAQSASAERKGRVIGLEEFPDSVFESEALFAIEAPVRLPQSRVGVECIDVQSHCLRVLAIDYGPMIGVPPIIVGEVPGYFRVRSDRIPVN